MRETTRFAISIATASFLLTAIAILFWRQDWRYSLPTAQPVNYTPPARGQQLDLPALSGIVPVADGFAPTFLHFYNPRCPCSRFNLDHFREVVKANRDGARFVVVVEAPAEDTTLAARQLAALNIPVIPDPSGRLAQACGVYSTPQAVILDATGRLYFRGNYNSARYCPDPQTQYARIALEALSTNCGRPGPNPGDPYGCELPTTGIASAPALAGALGAEP
jgi:hypothetical protein